MIANSRLRRKNGRLGRLLRWIETGVCACLIAAWRGSYFVIACFVLPYRHAVVALHRGAVFFLAVSHPLTPNVISEFRVRENPAAARWLPHWKTLRVGESRTTTLVTPFWILILAVEVPSAVIFFRNRRYASGHCRRCDYDLRGSPEPRCPECGTPSDRNPD